MVGYSMVERSDQYGRLTLGRFQIAIGIHGGDPVRAEGYA